MLNFMKNFILHLFYPRRTNNYRAKMLHHKVLVFLILLFFVSGIGLSFVKTNYPSVLGITSDITIDQLLVLTNQKRQEAGLSPLTLSEKLDQAASNKGNDMFSKNYWAHIAPDGTTPWYFIKGAGYEYIYAGENLARGYTTSTDVVNAWMASPTHKENMLSPKYKNVGFAILDGNLTGEDTVLVVEMFGSTVLAGEPAVAKAETSDKIAQGIQVTPTIILTPTTVPTTNTPTPTLIQVASNNLNGQVLNNTAQNQTPLINGLSFSSDIARFVVTLFIFILILDMFIIERKKIIRFVGHNLDHTLFLILILGLVLVVIKGAIL